MTLNILNEFEFTNLEKLYCKVLKAFVDKLSEEELKSSYRYCDE